MPDVSVTVTNQSNPFSLGGGGVNFETRVQSAYTVLMLTGSVVPCLPAWPIQKIKLQGKYAGFGTDDFIVFVEQPETKIEAKLLAQIKHEVSITENDSVFSDVIVAAWHDFNTPDVFTEGLDALALITGPLSSMDINHVRPLLEWARHCKTAQEFITKVNTPKFGSQTKQNKLKAFRSQLKATNGGTDVTDEILWRFLKSFYLIGYDLDSDSGSLLSLLNSLLSQSINNADVEGCWAKIVLAVQSANQNAGTLSLSTIPQNVLENLSDTAGKIIKRDVVKLIEHGKVILDNIQAHISGVHIDRNDLFLELLNQSYSSDFILITGPRGNGKSGIVREFATHLGNRYPVFCLRTEDLNKPHLDNVFTSIGLHGNFRELTSYFALIPQKYLLIESIEKLLELEFRNAFDDLLNFIRQSGNWTVIASGREYAFQQITFSFLNPKKVKWSSLNVPEFNEDEVEILLDKLPEIQPLGKNPDIRRLLHNPFMADLAVRAVEAGAQFSVTDGEAFFRATVWRNVIAKEDYRKDGLPARRKQTFIDIAVHRARAMVYGVPECTFDIAALLKLEEDHLVSRDSIKGLVSPAHDILEDWALAEFIETRFNSHGLDINDFVDSVGFQPAIIRAFRLWLHQKLRCEPESEDVVAFVNNVIRSQIPYWRDEAITAVLLGENPYSFLCRLRDQLFENEGELLKRFCFILRISCKATDTSFAKQLAGDDIASEIAEGLWMMPYGNGWEALVLFLCKNLDRITLNLIPHLTAVLDEWASKVNVNDAPPKPTREVGLLSLHLLEFVKDDYRREENRKKLLGVIIKVVSTITPEFQALLDRDIFNTTFRSRRETPGYTFQLLPMVLVSFESIFLCKYCPEILIKIAWHAWLTDEISDRYHPGVAEYFGLNEHSEGANFFPASGVKGPFRHLLVCHPRLALNFILELCNRTAERYAHSRLDANDKESILPTHYPQGVSTVEISLNDGTIVTQYCSHRLWCGYRGTSVLPYLLQSALMALENWLVLLAEASDNDSTLGWVFDYVLRNSNSVMPIAVLASIATGFPEKLGKAALPLLRTPALYEWDLIRSVQEAGALGAGYTPGDPFWKVYAEERKTGNQRPWRQEHLETLVTRLQFTELRTEIFPILDGFKANISKLCEDKGDDAWRYRINRIDLRNCNLQEDLENNRILFVPQDLEPDLREKQQEFQQEQTLRDRFTRLFLWSEKTFKREQVETNYFSEWQEALKETKELLEILKAGNTDELSRMQSGGIVKACAVFLRDHAAELGEENLEWCIPILVDIVLANARSDSHVNFDDTGYDGSIAAGNVLPKLIDYAEEGYCPEFLGLIATAMTHANGSVRCSVAAGIREHLWQVAPEIAQAFLNSALEYARLKQIEIDTQHYKNYRQEPEHYESEIIDQLPENWQDIFIQNVMNGTPYTASTLSWKTLSPWYLLPPLLMIPDGSTSPEHVSLFLQMISMLSEAEESERNYRYSSDERIELPDNLEIEFTKRLADYLLTISDTDAQVFVDLLKKKSNSAPDFIHWLLVCLLATSDKQKMLEKYWRLWNELSDSIQSIAKGMCKDGYKVNSNDYRTKLLRGWFFSDSTWDVAKPEEYLFEHGLEHIYRFAESAGVNPIIFEAMSRFLFYLPKVFMPKGLSILLKHQRDVGGTCLLAGVNTVYYLERVLQRLLIRDQNQASFSMKNRDEVLVLLSAIMETGSSTAYFLRERLLQMKLT
ncbi:MAG: ATP-binding protein [Geobacteraceae bacterium]|nr:ATP-binding protein [Geobacteraceae bacterium]